MHPPFSGIYLGIVRYTIYVEYVTSNILSMYILCTVQYNAYIIIIIIIVMLPAFSTSQPEQDKTKQ